MKQQRVDLDERLLPHQQLRHAVGHRQGDARGGRGRRQIRRREPGLAEDALERLLRARSSGVSDGRWPGSASRSRPTSLPSSASVARTSSNTAGDACRDALARFLARQPFRQRSACDDAPRRRARTPVARGGHDRVRSPGCRRSSRSVSRTRARPASACAVAVDIAHSPAQLDNRETRTATLLHERRRRIACTGVERSKARGASGGADRRARPVRIQHAAAANRDRRRVAAQDETIAARQHGVGASSRRRAYADWPGVTSAIAAGSPTADASATRPRSSRSRDGTARARRGAAARAPAAVDRRRRSAARRLERARRASACRRACTSATSTPPRLTATRRPAPADVLRRAVHLQAAHLHARVRRQQRSARRRRERRPAGQRAGHDRAEAAHREHAIDRQPRQHRPRDRSGTVRASGRQTPRAARRDPRRSSPTPATIGASSSDDPATSSRASSRASSSVSASTRSALVSATRPAGPAAAGRSRSARASAASPTRRPRRPAARRRCRRRRPACS